MLSLDKFCKMIKILTWCSLLSSANFIVMIEVFKLNNAIIASWEALLTSPDPFKSPDFVQLIIFANAGAVGSRPPQPGKKVQILIKHKFILNLEKIDSVLTSWIEIRRVHFRGQLREVI